MPTAETTWRGELPEKCQVCSVEIGDVFYDAALIRGPWAFLCPECHAAYGCGLGTGMGQKYERRAGGYVKTAG